MYLWKDAVIENDLTKHPSTVVESNFISSCTISSIFYQIYTTFINFISANSIY